MSSSLHIAPRFALPVEVAGEAIAILAKRGAGKTNTGRVLVEELTGAGVQTIVLDPVGSWWGLRYGADRKNDGLPMAILGGAHGDVPLEPTAGALIADVVVESGQSLVIDLSDFPSKASMNRFVTDFAERLYRRKARAQSLLHLVLEEADEFAPQKGQADTARMRGAIEAIVRRGRSRGLGVTLITQRSAVLNKDVLTQADVLIVMRTTGPQDVKAIEQWIASRADEGADEVLPSLPSLTTGEAWIWNPERGLLKRVQIRHSRTFDSGATPKAGKQRAEPTAAAPIDLTALGEQIAATAERAKATDPAVLQKKIRELERELAQRPAETKVVETVTEQVLVEVPVLDPELADRLHDEVFDLKTRAASLDSIAEQLAAALARARSAPPAAAAREQKGERREEVRPAVGPVSARPPARRPSAPASTGLALETELKLGKGELTVLDVLAEYPEGRTYNELAFLAGYSAKASTLGVILSNLRKADLVEPGNQPVRATADGLSAAGGVRERPTGQALLDHWLRHQRMGEGERRVLLALIEAYPDPLSHEELCERTGYSPIASTMGVILSKLRKLGLVEKGERRVATEFYEAIT